MKSVSNRLFRQIALWCSVLGAFICFFRFAAPQRAEASRDERTALSVLMPDGTVSRTTMAEFLPHVIAGEMPVSFGPEALKAQAVAARSYILASQKHADAAVCTDSACCLAYRSEEELLALWGDTRDADWEAVIAAAQATDGQVLTYDGSVIQAVFHASSAGMTEDSAAVWSAQPYLTAVLTPETEASVPDLVSTVRFSPEDLSARLGLETDMPPDSWLEDVKKDAAGRTELLLIAGQALSGRVVRAALGLRSTAFSVLFDGDDFVFTVAGNGHGVGMSQVGAKLLAAEGWTYDEILAHYYPGAELEIR